MGGSKSPARRWSLAVFFNIWFFGVYNGPFDAKAGRVFLFFLAKYLHNRNKRLSLYRSKEPPGLEARM